jgi:hypothetical protein
VGPSPCQAIWSIKREGIKEMISKSERLYLKHLRMGIPRKNGDSLLKKPVKVDPDLKSPAKRKGPKGMA